VIEMKGIHFHYGSLSILEDWDASFPKGSRYALLGPSGCGKTTLLKLCAGLISPESGLMMLPDHVSFLFQEPRLLPRRSIYQNLELPIRRYYQEAQRKERIRHILEQLELEDKQNYYPAQLSGGMQQRAAMARAFLFPSDLLLMDEPFKGQDPLLKLKLIKFLNRLLQEQPRTLLAVTHQVDEALMLADEIRLLSGLPLKEGRRWKNTLTRDERLQGGVEFRRQEDEILQVMLQSE